MKIVLPAPDGTLQPYQLSPPRGWPRPEGPPRSRVVYAAAHVVADPLGDPAAPEPAVDWDSTLRVRRHLWAYGLRVAEAMDTAQRNMGLDWTAARELAKRSADAAKDFGDPAELVAAGVGTDHAPDAPDLDAIVTAYSQQLHAIRATEAGVVLMASRELAALARAPEDYLKVYGAVLSQADRPVIVHWLGEMFDPALAGYWGSPDIWRAAETLLQVIRENIGKIDGVKVSLLDAQHEVALRTALPAGVRLYTGDDFNYPSLIASGSHALLGIFDAIAPAASTALHALDEGDMLSYERDPRAHRDAVAEDLRGADLQLQDRAGVPVLAGRAPGRVRHDPRRPGGAVAAAPGRGVPPRGQRRPAAGPRPLRPPDERAAHPVRNPPVITARSGRLGRDAPALITARSGHALRQRLKVLPPITGRTFSTIGAATDNSKKPADGEIRMG